MPDLYCTRGDVNDWISTGEIAGRAHLVAESLASTNALTLDGHGLETDDPVKVRAVEGGNLPAPLAAGTLYYAVRLTNATFSLAAAPAGGAIDLTTDGASVVVSREPKYDKVIEFWSRWADGFLPAHALPLTTSVHPLIRGIVAKLAAYDLMGLEGKDSARALAARDTAQKALERYAAGLPLRGAPVTASTNLAVVARVATDPRGWGSGGTIP